MRRLIGFILCAVVFVCSAAPGANAQDAKVSATARVDTARTVVGDAITYEIKVEGARSADTPVLGEISGANVSYIGGSDSSVSSVMIINGRRSETRRESYVMQWRITPTREGTLRIPAAEVRVGGAILKTGAVIVRVGAAQQTGDMTLVVRAGRDRVYVGEAVEVVIRWRCMLSPRTAEFTNIGKDQDGIRWFDAPASPNGERQELELLGERVVAAQRVVQTSSGQAIEFEIRRFVVPQRSGKVVIGPLSVRSDLVVRKARGFFDRDQTRRAGAVSDAVVLDVQPLPTRSAGDGQRGAVLVGRYEVRASASRARVRMGDPLTVTVRVIGAMAGRVGTFRLDEIPGFSDGFRISDEVERRELDDGSLGLTYTVRVTSDEVTEIPAVELVCFDTEKEQYRTIRSRAIPLHVEATRVVTATDGFGAAGAGSGSGVEDAGGGIMHNYSGEVLLRPMGFSIVDAARSAVWVGAAATPPTLFAGALVLIGARRARERNGSRKASGRRAIGEARRAIGGAADGEGIAAGVRGYMRDRFEIGGEVTADAIARVAPGESGRGLVGVLERCDAARFGAGESVDIAAMRGEAVGALEAVERAQRKGGSA